MINSEPLNLSFFEPSPEEEYSSLIVLQRLLPPQSENLIYFQRLSVKKNNFCVL